MMKTNALVALWAALMIPSFMTATFWHDPSACDDAYAISCGTLLNDISNSGYPNKLDNYDCSGAVFASGYNGRERIFKLRVTTEEIYTIRLSDVANPEVNFDLFLMRGSCEAGNCILSSTNTSNKSESISALLEVGDYYLVVDTWKDEYDTFDLNVSCEPAPDPVICYDAYRINCGELAISNTLNAENRYNSSNYNCYSGSGSYDGPDDIYSFYKNNSSDRVQIHMFTDNVDLNIFLVNKCDNDGFSCVLSGSTFKDGKFIDELYYGLPKGEYYVIVDGKHASTNGRYELVVTCGSGFEDAMPIDCDEVWTEEDLNNGVDNQSVYDCGSKNGFRQGLIAEEKLYSFSLRRSRNITVRVEDTGEDDGIEVFLYGGIPLDHICASIGEHVNGEIIINKDLGPGDYTIVVDGKTKGAFEIELIGCECLVDGILECDTPITSSTTGGENNISLIAGECQAWPLDTDAEDRVFEFVAPESQNYVFQLTNMTEDLDLFILEDCTDPYSCLGSSTKLTEEYVNVSLNQGQIVYAVVDSRSRLVLSDFIIAVSCDNDADGDGVEDDDDNCTLIANANQLDTDSDGKGDVCDLDDDGDDVSDDEDCEPLNSAVSTAIGDLCDDHNASTENDVINADCECMGIEITNDQPIQLSIENGNGKAGDIVCVDILATEFENVASTSFSITINNDIADILSITNLGLTGGNFTGSLTSITGSGGQMTGSGSGMGGFVVWSADPGETLTLGPITPIVEVCVEMNFNAIEKGTLSINNAIKDVEFFNANADPIAFELGDGTICRDSTPTSMRTISGLVMDPSEKMVEGVEMAIAGGMIGSDVTAGNGAYAFEVPASLDYEITPKMLDATREGVTLLDVLIFRKHFVYVSSFEHPYQYLAADIDGNGALSVRDELLMKNIILGLDDDTYPFFTFVQADHDFGNIEPFTVDGKVFQYPQNARIEGLESDVQEDFVAIRMGDLNAEYLSTIRSVETKTLIVEDRLIPAGSIVTIPVHLENAGSLAGMIAHIELLDRHVEILNVEAAMDGITAMNGVSPEGNPVIALFSDAAHVNVAANETILRIQIRTDQPSYLSKIIGINGSKQSEWIDSDLASGAIALEFERSITAVELSVGVHPNPASTMAIFEVESPISDANASITIYDVSGRSIDQMKVNLSVGMNKINWNTSNSGIDKGMVLYELSANGVVRRGKLILVE